MPRRYSDGFDAPPSEGSGGAIFIIFLGFVVVALVLGSGWLSAQALLNRKTASVSPTVIATPLPTAVTSNAIGSAAPTVVPTAAPVAPDFKPAVPDWIIANGHFFTQTNGQPPMASARGFAVTNEAGIPVWDEFRRLGGADVVGYPLSRRFSWQGRVTQIFQRAVLQWNQASFRMEGINILNELHHIGRDRWLLEKYSVPMPLSADFDAGKQFDAIVQGRLALLDPDPAIATAYRAVSDSTSLYGLPDSVITDMNSHWAIRLQRGVLQRWKSDQPWAGAGAVTAANSGAIAIAASIFPSDQLQPESPPTSAVSQQP